MAAPKDPPKASGRPRVPRPDEGLSAEESERVQEALPLRSAVVYEIIRTEGEGELKRHASALWWSGFAAGISIGFSFLAEAALRAHLPAAEWTPLVSKAGYTVGFLIVILGRQQFFTENTLTAVLPVITRRRLDWLGAMLRLWGIVLLANVAGCFLFALALSALTGQGEPLARELSAMVAHLMENDAASMIAKGIGAGWLIAALVWMMPSSQGSEFLVIALVTYLLALFGFTHVVVGSCEVLYGWSVGEVGAADALFKFFLPALFGNIVGGTVLFAVLSYAQVKEEIDEPGASDPLKAD